MESMSPTLAIQGKELKLGSPKPNVDSNGQNAALPEKEFMTGRPSQTFLPQPDICANSIEAGVLNWSNARTQIANACTYLSRQVSLLAFNLRYLRQLGSSIGTTQVHKPPTSVLI